MSTAEVSLLFWQVRRKRESCAAGDRLVRYSSCRGYRVVESPKLSGLSVRYYAQVRDGVGWREICENKGRWYRCEARAMRACQRHADRREEATDETRMKHG